MQSQGFAPRFSGLKVLRSKLLNYDCVSAQQDLHPYCLVRSQMSYLLDDVRTAGVICVTLQGHYALDRISTCIAGTGHTEIRTRIKGCLQDLEDLCALHYTICPMGLPGFEPGCRESKSRVLPNYTTTPYPPRMYIAPAPQGVEPIGLQNRTAYHHQPTTVRLRNADAGIRAQVTGLKVQCG